MLIKFTDGEFCPSVSSVITQVSQELNYFGNSGRKPPVMSTPGMELQTKSKTVL